MGTLQRDVVGHILKVFIFSLLATSCLMTLGGAAKDAVRQGLPLYLLLRTLPYFLPEILRFTIPGCLLFAVCSVFGRLSANNELLAVKSAGVHLIRIIWPALVLAYLLSIGTFWLYDVCAQWSRPNLTRVLTESVDDIACSVIRAGGSFQKSGLAVFAPEVQDRVLKRPVVMFMPQSETAPITLTARQAELQTDRQAGSLRIVCYDSELDLGNKGVLRVPGEFTHEVKLSKPRSMDEDTASPAAVPMNRLARQVRREQQLVAAYSRAVQRLRDADRRQMAAETLQRHEQRLSRFQAESQRRLANGVACLCFAMIGIPVAIWRQSADNVSVFFLCFGPILLVYYPLLIVGETVARAGFYPGLAVWLADAVLLATGAGLLWRVTRF